MNRVTIEDAQIYVRNFAGAPDKFNPGGGKRYFCVFVDDPAQVQALIDDGWNVKHTAGNPDYPPRAYLQVSLGWEYYPPKIVRISAAGRVPLDEDSVSILDWDEFENVDIVIRPYNWEAMGRTGKKAYLKTMYVTVREDELDLKYASSSRGLPGEDPNEVPF